MQRKSYGGVDMLWKERGIGGGSKTDYENVNVKGKPKKKPLRVSVVGLHWVEV